MTDSKDAKGTKGTKGPHNLRVQSPLSEVLDALIYRVIGIAMRVHSKLGPGLLESVYRDALAIALGSAGLKCRREVAVDIVFEGKHLRRCRLDIVVEEQLIIEVKAVSRLHPTHSAQMLTYMRCTDKPAGLILNFNEAHLKDGIRRHVLKRPNPQGAT